MSEVVIDTNVWVLADRITSDTEGVPDDEVECIEACYYWLSRFAESSDQLVVDYSYRVLSKYRENIRKGGFAEQTLNRLESAVLERLVFVDIPFDSDEIAVLPFPVTFEDPDDRKFIALALARDPIAPIYNASDTDWEKEREQLAANGLTIRELCPDYIEERLRE